MAAALQRLLSNPKDFPDARLNVGDFYLRIREWDEAKHQYQEGMSADPKRKSVYQKRLVELLVREGRKQDAAQYLADILKANPKDFEAQAMHASLLLDTGGTKDLVTAIGELQSLVPRTSDNPNPVLRFELGRAYWMKGDFGQAEVQFKEAIKIKPDYLPPRLALAQLVLFKGDFPLANQMANEMLRFSPKNVPARLIRARSLAGLRKFEEARADLLEAQKDDPTSSDVAFQVGVLQTMERKYKEAEDTFRKLYQNSDYRGLAGLTEVYAAQQQFDRSIQLLQSELAKSPANATVRSYLGNMAVRAGKYDLAISQFKSLIEQDPKREDVYIRLGETYHRSGDPTNAAECFRKAKDLAPNDPLPHLQLALLLESLGRRDEAKTIYEKTLKLQPDNPIALNNLAYMMAETGGDLDQALTLAQRAKQRLPQDPNVGDTLGWIYIKKNLSDNAVEVLRDLVNKDPKNATYRYHFGMALLQKGDKFNAKKELQTALQNKPSKEEEGKIRELIAKIG